MTTTPASQKRAAGGAPPAAVAETGGATSPQTLEPASADRAVHQVRYAVGLAHGFSRHDLERTEWLLTDGCGGFAMGTAAGIPTRRYHGWFIPATSPPVGRVVTLHSAVERITIIDARPAEATAGAADRSCGCEQPFDISSYMFPGDVTHPKGIDGLAEFRTGADAQWIYRFQATGGEVFVSRQLVLLGGAGIGVRYRVWGPGAAQARIRIEVRPLIAMRDFHELSEGRRDPVRLAVGSAPGVVTIRAVRDGPLQIPALHLSLRSAGEHSMFGGPGEWWHDFEYARDRERGQSFREDLYAPGLFTAEDGPATGGLPIEFELLAWTGDEAPVPMDHALRAGDERIARLLAGASGGLPEGSAAERGTLAALVRASDQFVVHRRRAAGAGEGGTSANTSVIAGYPWFSDWGRDAMICLPGLLLTTGRYTEARSMLEGFAGLCRNGLIPNCFDNGTGAAEYNTVDASLWFVHSACRYASDSGDRGVAEGPIGGACLAIIDAYQRGTDFNIRVDPSDGLVSAGSAATQLTWMDARRDGVVFTPRAGKAVEINALWYNALLSAADLVEKLRPRTSRDLRQLAERVRGSFQAKFFDAYRRMCFDVVPGPGSGGVSAGGVDPAYQLRPNQIFAVSLPHSPLDAEQQQAVVKAVRGSLLTPMGLRTLAASDREYQPRYEGNLFSRDRAYHNGTVWPWLMGPMAEAVMRVGQFSEASRREARELMRPLIDEVLIPRAGRAIGQLAEIYDGEDLPGNPRRAEGCAAQAWSVAEILRVFAMASAGTPRAI